MIGVLGPMLGPALKLAALNVRKDVEHRGLDVVAADYAGTIRQLVRELPEPDKILVVRILEHLGPLS